MHVLTFSEWLDRLRAGCKREEGQTMAEYGVVLAVITVASGNLKSTTQERVE